MTTGDGKKMSCSYGRVPQGNLRIHLLISSKLECEAARTFRPDQVNVTTVYLLQSKESVLKNTIKKVEENLSLENKYLLGTQNGKK